MIIATWAPIAIVLGKLMEDSAPLIPDSNTSVFSFKPGDFEVIAAASIAYVWLVAEDFPRSHRRWVTGVGLIAILVGAVHNRGGLLGAVSVLAIAASHLTSHDRRRLLGSIALLVIGTIGALTALNVSIPLGERSLSFNQLAANVLSITGTSEDQSLQGTANWRIENWSVVIDDAVSGEQWLVGRGYGPNLADIHGFQTSLGTQSLRNAHNSHLTLFARLGFVGLAFWTVLWLHIGLLMFAKAKLRDPITGWLLAIVVGIGIAAIFDPSLEGPQMAVPFWFALGGLAGLKADRRSG